MPNFHPDDALPDLDPMKGRVLWPKALRAIGRTLGDARTGWWELTRQREWAGEIIMAAVRAGLLDLPGLGELVDLHSSPTPRLRDGEKAVRVHGPANLFGDWVGGHIIRVRRDGNGKIEESLPSGGLALRLRLLSGHGTRGERERMACELLAELIEAAPAATAPAPQSTAADGVDGYVTADYLRHDHGIDPTALSRAVGDGKLRSIKAPAGYLSSEGKKVRVLYCKDDALKHCQPQHVKKKSNPFTRR